MPTVIVRILCFWYRSQQLCIQWGKTKSLFFRITNGVLQGGILSPKLFSVYMDDLSKMLNDSSVGCYVDNVCVNHVFYADDLCLIAPCAIALQQLINVCHRYSIMVDLNFNALKSFCFAFTPRLYKLCSRRYFEKKCFLLLLDYLFPQTRLLERLKTVGS